MIRRIRLGSGLVLFAFVASHLVNLAWGLASLEAIDVARDVFLVVWRSWPGIIALYGALIVHVALALWALYERRTLRMAPREGVQLALGFAIPFMLAEHALGTRGLNIFFQVEDNYIYEILVLWVYAPEKGAFQIGLMAVAWMHGCMGLNNWLRLMRWYPRCSPYLLSLGVLVPACATFGFVAAGREINLLRQDPFWLEEATMLIGWPMDPAIAWLVAWKHIIWYSAGGLIGAVIVLRALRWLIERLQGRVRLRYPDGRVVDIRPGASVLEASRDAGIPHAAVCGGRGRCSTCRVRLGEGAADVAPPDEEEAKVLRRVGVPVTEPETVRLACQVRPTADLEVTPLLPPNVTPKEAWRKPAYMQGAEREIAVLFADIRAFTRFAEHKLPYDVVFVLNRYFRAMGTAVTASGGQLDKFIGDGVMVLFGAECDGEEASRRALVAARNMATALDELNASLANDLDEPLRIGIGIHVGQVIIGEMGFAGVTSITAIGDTVNTASRLEQSTKEFHCQLVVSDELADRAGVDLSTYPGHKIALRGRDQVVAARAIASAHDLPTITVQKDPKRG